MSQGRQLALSRRSLHAPRWIRCGWIPAVLCSRRCLPRRRGFVYAPCVSPQPLPSRPGTGVDGCGSMLLVLVSQGLSPNNSFVSPLVSSYTKRGASQDLLVQATEGTVIPPTAAELEAAAASSDPDSAWLGCIVAPRAVMAGALVEVRATEEGLGGAAGVGCGWVSPAST